MFSTVFCTFSNLFCSRWYSYFWNTLFSLEETGPEILITLRILSLRPKKKKVSGNTYGSLHLIFWLQKYKNTKKHANYSVVLWGSQTLKLEIQVFPNFWLFNSLWFRHFLTFNFSFCCFSFFWCQFFPKSEFWYMRCVPGKGYLCWKNEFLVFRKIG